MPEYSPEDISRFLIREFLKRNKMEETYEKFIEEDTREKTKMTKNELTSILGIESLVKKNSAKKSHKMNTMIDVVCDYFMKSKVKRKGKDGKDAEPAPKKDLVKNDEDALGDWGDFTKKNNQTSNLLSHLKKQDDDFDFGGPKKGKLKK